MGWKTSSTSAKPRANSINATTTRTRASIEINGSELGQVVVTIEDPKARELLTQRSLTSVIGKMLRLVGDELENAKKDSYKITNYGQV